jgi:hypothetical protein
VYGGLFKSKVFADTTMSGDSRISKAWVIGDGQSRSGIEMSNGPVKLDSETGREYYIAIRENNIDVVSQVIGSHPENKLAIVNEEIFSCLNEVKNMDPLVGKFRSSLPIFVAALSGSTAVLDLLMSHGAEIQRHDSEGNNIIHALCWTGFCCKEREAVLVSIYQHIVGVLRRTGGLKALLHHENNEGLRPLELASRLGTFRLLEAIVDTEGVYKTVHAYTGPFESVTYELAEYESWDDDNRHRKSPLRFLLHMRGNDLGDACSTFFQTPLMLAWINRKLTSVLMPLIALVTLQLLFFVCFILYEELALGSAEELAIICEDINKTMQQMPEWQVGFYSQVWLHTTLEVIVQGYCSFSILFDIVEVGLLVYKRHQYAMFDRPIKTRGYVTSSTFFRITHFAMVFLTLTSNFVPSEGDDKTVDDIIMLSYIVGSILVIWSLLFFLQILPSIGHLVMGFQATLATLFNFIILNSIIFLSFVKAFNMIARSYCLNFVDESLFENIYYSFKVLLNIYQDPIGKDEYGRVPFIITHVTFIIVMVILMLNFLITAIAASSSDVTNHADVMRSLKRVEVAIILETRLRFAVSILKANFLKLKVVTFGDIYNVQNVNDV